MKNILIIDDHKLFSSGLQLILDKSSNDFNCYTFENLDECLKSICLISIKPDLFIIDYYIPGCNASELIQHVKHVYKDSHVIVISASINPTDKKLAIKAGAELFLSKSVEPEILLDATLSLLSGRTPTDLSSNEMQLSEKFNLTPRQLQVLVLVSKGYANKEIAQLLKISPETVKSHLSDIFQKFDATNRIEAIDIARYYGLN